MDNNNNNDDDNKNLFMHKETNKKNFNQHGNIYYLDFSIYSTLRLLTSVYGKPYNERRKSLLRLT